MDIKNKVAVISGGASGIGEATARHFVAHGAHVAIFDVNERKAAALLKELGGAAIFCPVDVTDESSVQSGMDATSEEFGQIHICCNFAGVADAARTIGKQGPFPLETFKRVIDINLTGTFNVIRLAAEKMALNQLVSDESGRGVIINTASIAAFEGQMGQAAYSASKAGVAGLTLPVARDLASLGIRCNTIVPGLIKTPMFDSLAPEFIESLSNSVLNPKRLGRPEEVAHLAQFIVENDYLNGECIRLDGGIRMQPR
ncbi:3-hydroxy-2-methylbutyryl-CoA dehydrogenase [Endozoicomonas montiporae]|uniref:3-hydroxy-2-methylbutyryl-CoA dehydrogenase n=2 Tax=Endozoicomonas montiporae TaxID=1027273 RepID=A0A081NB55_9GAMM|nr:SDR family oxidoreductase [Endozoicomonas montiporae]AMO56606.1 3-hydroxyacyl-CoA dehydrogenase [Endozoicomonas montiporae CL-33]KEQ15678.1 3-hydroxy-2-methylbutyryl-CoA dehydrogenase [Endozoicomonas montiporae]